MADFLGSDRRPTAKGQPPKCLTSVLFVMSLSLGDSKDSEIKEKKATSISRQGIYHFQDTTDDVFPRLLP